MKIRVLVINLNNKNIVKPTTDISDLKTLEGEDIK
jgi:hypothetical protein